MKLTEQEIYAVNTRLKKYRRLYREVFDELYDHILSLVELKRENGDDREIKEVLQDVVDIDFEGDRGLHRIALRRFTLFRSGLWTGLWGHVKQNRVQFWVLSILTLCIAYFVPDSRDLTIGLVVSCFVLSSIPLGYLIYIKGFKGVFYKGSVKLSTIGTFAMYPINMSTIVFCLPLAVTRLIEGHSRSGSIYVSGIGLVCILAYSIGFIRFCNEEIKEVGHR